MPQSGLGLFRLSRLNRLLLVRRNHIFHFVPTMSLPPQPSIPGEYQFIYPCDFQQILSQMCSGQKHRLSALQFHIEQGHQLGVVVVDHQIVHQSLVQIKGVAAIEGDPRAILLQLGQAYIHYSETSVGYRGLGLYPAMLRVILARVRQEPGFTEALIACRQDNIASIRGILKGGVAYKCSTFTIGFWGERLSYSRFYISHCPPVLAA